MKIDIHNHILPENWPDLKEKYGYGGWCQINHKSDGTAEMIKDGQHVFRIVERNCYCGKTRVEDMNKAGVTVQALSTVPVMFSYWAKPEDTADLCRFLNDDMAGVIRKHPDRFVGLGTLPMQAPELAVEEIKRCKHDLGFAGFEIGSHVNNWNLSAKELWPIYATAQEHDCALFVHPWDMASDKRNNEYWMPWLVGMPTETTMAICSMIFGGVFERFPRLKVCFAHGAGSFPYTCGRIQHGFNCRPDIVAVDNKVPPLSYLNRIYADSLVHDKSALLYLLQTLGDDKVMLGSDYPFPLGEDPAGKLIESLGELTDNQKSKLLYSNAVDFLGLDATKYLKN